jgi:spore coat protein CotH
MKKLKLVLLLSLGISFLGFSQDFYDINSINTIEITFEQSNWDYLLDQLVSAGNEERLMGTATINGVVYDSVGVRYKGNSSYQSNQVKNPLNIKLDYVINDQDIEGYGTLKLANAYKDPSFVRETIGYEIARKYFPASQANYINLYINGTHLGLYTSVQDVDKFFMRTHLNNDEGVRIKGEITTGGGGPPSGSVWKYLGTDSTDYYSKYALESDIGWGELIQFLDTLNNHTSYVDQVLNLDRHLWFLAYSNLLVNLDGPINNPQNYYLFKDEANRFNPIPWDLNESFGVFSMHQTLGNLGTSQLQQLSPFANLNESDYPIISKILTNTTYRKMYVAHMKTMIEENFSNGLYEDRALEIQDIIDADVQADLNKFYTYSDFLNNINSSVGGGGWPPSQPVIGITQLMEARINYITGLSEFEAQAPEISNINYSPEQVSPNTELWFTAEVDYANQVFLGYRQSIVEPFMKVEMYDDGAHNDGQANDGVYGISIITGSSDLLYYIYANNNDAASFSPVRAEYEFYSITITGDLVINEFMADNETTITDQDGEYDDWIELYNNGNEDISLNGYYLSDDASTPDQWVFPDTTIAAGGYLIVWADNDEDQEGLHANFKLSSSGETILLSNASLNILDEVSYEQQYADTTTGRFPNGTGDFILMPPTFGSENFQSLTFVNEDQAVDLISFMAYPNPFSNQLCISFNLQKQELVQIEIYNIYGQSMAPISTQYFSEGHHEFNIDTTSLPTGLCVCNLIVDDRVYNLKLLKVRNH